MKPRRPLFACALAALCALLLSLCWRRCARVARPPAVDAGAGAVAAPRAAPPREVERAAVAQPRADAAPSATEEVGEAELDHPYRFHLRLELRGRFGAPVADASVFVAPQACGFSRWPERSDGSGRVDVRWPGRRRATAVTVAVLADGVLQPMRRVELLHGVTRRLAVGVRAAARPVSVRARAAARGPDELARDARRVRRARERTEQGRMQRLDALDVLCARSTPLFSSFTCLECHARSRVGGYLSLAAAGEMAPGLHAHAVFQDLGARAEAEPAGEAERAARRARAERLQQQALDAEGGGRGGYVVGVVSDLDGAPVQGATVCSVGAHGAVERMTSSDSEGRYRLGPFPTGAVELTAVGGRAGFAAVRLEVEAGLRTEWAPALRSYRAVAGTVRDDQGRPLEGWIVELVRDEGDWAALTETDRRGGFAVHGVPGAVVAAIWPRGAGRGVPVLYNRAAMVDARALDLALHPDVPTRARLRVHVGVPAALRGARVDARVVQVETGVVARLEPMGYEDAFELEPLPPGAYRLQLGAEGAGWVETGRVAVDGRGLWDVGRYDLPGPGRVRVRAPDGAAPLEPGRFAFYRRTADCDVLSRHRERGGVYELPPGEHLLVREAAGRLRAARFVVRSGEEVEVVLTRGR